MSSASVRRRAACIDLSALLIPSQDCALSPSSGGATGVVPYARLAPSRSLKVPAPGSRTASLGDVGALRASRPCAGWPRRERRPRGRPCPRRLPLSVSAFHLPTPKLPSVGARWRPRALARSLVLVLVLARCQPRQCGNWKLSSVATAGVNQGRLPLSAIVARAETPSSEVSRARGQPGPLATHRSSCRLSLAGRPC